MNSLKTINLTLGLLGLVGITLFSCSKTESTPTVATATATTATYSVTVKFLWNAPQHGALPSGAHFSPLFATSHDNTYFIYKKGTVASAGVELVAETGATSTLKSANESAKGAHANYLHTGSSTPTATITFDITVEAKFPYLSLISMIAPSPDWFVGLSSIELYTAAGGFKTNVSGNMNVYDAGTEEGTGFGLNNPATNPVVGVTLLTSMNNVSFNNTTQPMASYTIVKK